MGLHAALARHRLTSFKKILEDADIDNDTMSLVFFFTHVNCPQPESRNLMLSSKTLLNCSRHCRWTLTSRILNRFCTTYDGFGRRRKLVRLRNHIRKVIHVITTDAASEEVLSAELSRKVHGLNKLSPNCRTIVRDKPHGSRRLITRLVRVSGKQKRRRSDTGFAQRVTRPRIGTETQLLRQIEQGHTNPTGSLDNAIQDINTLDTIQICRNEAGKAQGAGG